MFFYVNIDKTNNFAIVCQQGDCMQNHDDINEIFEELSNAYTSDTFDAIAWGTRDSVANRVSSFSEIITEWFLFGSDVEQDISDFLKSEHLDNILDESDFIDLVCGNAYMENEAVRLISAKLPFKITVDRLLFLNNEIKKNNANARCIKRPAIKTERDKQREREQRYYAKYREKLILKKRQYWQSHKDILLKRKKERYHANKEYFHEYSSVLYHKHKEARRQHKAEYRQKNREKLLVQQRQYYAEHKEDSRERKKKYYKENRIKLLQKKKQYDIEHSTEIKQYYETNKQRILLTSEQARKKRRQYAKMARNVCAVYLFLMNLKKRDMEQYSKLYRTYQEPVSGMMKTCVALQNMDFSLCPLTKNLYTNYKQCACPKVFKIQGAIAEIQKYIESLKQNQK